MAWYIVQYYTTTRYTSLETTEDPEGLGIAKSLLQRKRISESTGENASGAEQPANVG